MDAESQIKVSFVGHELTGKAKSDIWELLCACDDDFYPRLSLRERPDQKELQLTGSAPSTLNPSTLNPQHPQPRKYFEQILSQEFILAEDGDGFAGFLSFRRESSCSTLPGLPEALYMTTVCVDRAKRGRGVMSALYDCLENEARRAFGVLVVFTRTWSLNGAQMHTLVKRGYTADAVLKNDRGPGVDTVYFVKRFAEKA